MVRFGFRVPSLKKRLSARTSLKRAVLIDQNLLFRLVDVLLPRFLGSCHVRDVALAGEDDERIWRFAREEGFCILTKDNDFLARALVRGNPPQVIQVYLGNTSTRQIAAVLQARADEIDRVVVDNAESVFLLRG